VKYEAVIGLEVHAQMLTDTDLLRLSTKFGSEPNSQTCQICIGMPGVLPVLNKGARIRDQDRPCDELHHSILQPLCEEKLFIRSSKAIR
jgi:hypothetical protein